MATKVRVPNKASWSLDEAILEHDPEMAELLRRLFDWLEVEGEKARDRYDTKAQLRIAEAAHTLARLQYHQSRLVVLHRLARQNEYDKR